MNILFTRFPLESTCHGGAENQTMWLLEGLKARGHEISFLGSCPALRQRVKGLGIGDWSIGIGPPPVTKWGAVSFLWRRKTMRQKLIEAIEKLQASSFKLQAIFMLSLTEKLLLTDWAAENGIKVFWIEHDRIGSWLRWNPWLPAMRRASRKATIVCVSELSKKRYEELGFDSKRIVVIPNGVPSLSFSFHSKLKAQSSKLHLGCIARLSPEKGIDVLLQAIQPVPEFSLTIVGKGPEEGYVRRLISEDTERMGTSLPRIRLIPFVNDLDSFYASIDALVLPSVDHDPFGLVAAEAMMRGVPVVVTDACGIASCLQDKIDALIVKAGDAGELQQAMESLADILLRERLSENGKRTAEREFSLAAMVDKYEQLLQS